MSFANSYWSSDYITGIESLKSQTTLSLKQLHELRQLVFKYMNYYHANGQHLDRMADDTAQSSYLLRSPGKPRELAKRRIVSGQKPAPLQPSSNEKPDLDVPVTLDVPLSMYTKDLRSESMTLMNLASNIDKQVLENINDFIKHHEPYIRSTIDRLDQLVSDYINEYPVVEKLKTDYNKCRRAKEFADQEKASEAVPVVNEVEAEEVEDSESSTLNDTVEDEGDTEFDFPLFIGPCKLKSQKELSAFLRDAISKVDTTKRGFPLPGQKPDIFSSEELCKFLIHRRPFKLNATRLNLERFGQGILDLKLITSTSLIGSKKFKSENMWFEWSDLAIFVSKYEPLASGDSTPVPGTPGSTPAPSEKGTPNNKPKQRLLDEVKPHEAGKRFNDMFKSMKLSILHTNYDEKLVKLEQQYNEKYYDLQELKYLIDSEVLDRSQYLEKFERMKIALTYQSLTKLLEIIYHFSLESTTRIRDFASTLLSDVNQEQFYANDFKNLLERFSTGIYCPSILSPDQFQKKQYSTTQANNNFQNLKLGFNLYKDIPLQLQLSQTDNGNTLLSLSSLPFFIYQITKVVEHKDSKLEILQEMWESAINHQKYWLLKEKIIRFINQQTFDHMTNSNENAIQQVIIENITNVLNEESTESVVNFLKNWLLEIGDSLIPCLVYDSWVQLYKNDNNPTAPDIVKILSVIPRSNVSSLIYIMEHMAMVYQLNQIPSYGLYDEFPEELISQDEESDLTELANKLNTMETIGAVPFLHLLFRPSPIKSAGGLKPPLKIYNAILKDLLNTKFRCAFFNHLVNSEKLVIEKKQQEKKTLGLQKKVNLPTSPSRPAINADIKSPKALPASETFSLRPFHTKVTPAPSPSASPRHLSRELFDESTPRRDRSTSGTFVTPTIDVEFAKD